ncbi:MAG: YicC/YloC family endoribonuclease [Longimicrobiales bacterium]|nr:YicC/YloC family endoribonuclease [Longimicrobiales bacterium]
MIRSMTGYGDAERDTAAGRLRLEVKTVNHRFFNTSLRTPSGFDRWENAITDALKQHILRGHVSASLSIDRSARDEAEAVVDLDRARGYYAALERLKEELVLAGEPNLSMLSRFSDIFRPPEAARTAGIGEDVLVELTLEAARKCREMREAEGERLEADLTDRLDAVGEGLDVVESRAPERLVEERDRLRESVRALTEEVEVDEERLSREIAYLAERWDINEEVVRFRSHIELFREALTGDASEPVGKRLGFLVQEMHREANTIASKANDADITEAAVGIKEEIERLREQIENVE